MNFLKALEKLPDLIAHEQKKIVEIEKDLPILREVVDGSWQKEQTLSGLKIELAAVERKIQISITRETEVGEVQQEKGEKQSQDELEVVYVRGIQQ